MNNKYFRLPIAKGRYLVLGITITAFAGLMFTSEYYEKNILFFLIVAIISYLASLINIPLFSMKSYEPEISKDLRNFINREFGDVSSTKRKGKKIIYPSLNVNLGFLILMLFSFYLITKIRLTEFLILLAISTILFTYLNRFEEGIGILNPFIPVFLILSASIYLDNNPSYLFYSSSIIGSTLAMVFEMGDVIGTSSYDIDFGGRGSYETLILITLISILLLF